MIRRIFQLSAEGHGFRGDREDPERGRRAVPRAQRGALTRWAPSSVREVLYRDRLPRRDCLEPHAQAEHWGVRKQARRPAVTG